MVKILIKFHFLFKIKEIILVIYKKFHLIIHMFLNL